MGARRQILPRGLFFFGRGFRRRTTNVNALFGMTFKHMITFCHTCKRATRHAAQPEGEEAGRRFVEIECERCQTLHRVYLDCEPEDAGEGDSTS